VTPPRTRPGSPSPAARSPASRSIAARKSPAGAEILWIAVDAVRRGRGHGTALLGHVLASLADDGVSVVEAKTLDQSSGYRPYEASRAFQHRLYRTDR
jgi:GNAT superfamily N-acetyltransferase